MLSVEKGERVDYDMLKTSPVPTATDSYTPVGHSELAHMVRMIGQDILHDFVFYKEQYALARDGKQMFGIHTFKNSSSEMGLSIGFRNSYDKSLSIGIALGASVFVCDNLSFTGDVMLFRKHTSNVLEDIHQLILSAVYSQKSNFLEIQKDAEKLKEKEITDDSAFKMMGLLYGRGIMSPRQLPVILHEWLHPSYEDFKPRNAWSLYNACTEALKTAPPQHVMEKHIRLHHLFGA